MPLNENNKSKIEPKVDLLISDRPDGGTDVIQKVSTSIQIDFEGKNDINLMALQRKLFQTIEEGYENFNKDYDLNKDGKVTHSDFEPKLLGDVEVLKAKAYDKIAMDRILRLRDLDTNQDGKLSKEEWLDPKNLPKQKNGAQPDENVLG